jgi:hypothetical protein
MEMPVTELADGGDADRALPGDWTGTGFWDPFRIAEIRARIVERRRPQSSHWSTGDQRGPQVCWNFARARETSRAIRKPSRLEGIRTKLCSAEQFVGHVGPGAGGGAHRRAQVESPGPDPGQCSGSASTGSEWRPGNLENARFPEEHFSTPDFVGFLER